MWWLCQRWNYEKKKETWSFKKIYTVLYRFTINTVQNFYWWHQTVCCPVYLKCFGSSYSAQLSGDNGLILMLKLIENTGLDVWPENSFTESWTLFRFKLQSINFENLVLYIARLPVGHGFQDLLCLSVTNGGRLS